MPLMGLRSGDCDFNCLNMLIFLIKDEIKKYKVIKDISNAAETLNIGTACSVWNENQVLENVSKWKEVSKVAYKII